MVDVVETIIDRRMTSAISCACESNMICMLILCWASQASLTPCTWPRSLVREGATDDDDVSAEC